MLTTLNIVFLIIGIISLVAFGFLLVSSFKRSVLWGLAVLLLPFATLFYGIKYWHEVKKPFLIYVGTNTLCLVAVIFVFTQLGGMQAIDMAAKINDGSMTEQDAAQFMVGTLEGMEKLGAGGKEEMLAQMRADPSLSEQDIKQFEQMFGQIEKVASGEEKSFVDGNWQQQGQDGPLQLAMAADAGQGESMDDIEAKIAEMEAKMAMMGVSPPVAAESSEKESANPNVGNLGYPMPEYVDSPFKGQAQATSKAAKKTSGAISFADARHYIGNTVSVTTSGGVTRRATLVEVHPESLEFQRRAYGGAITFKVYKHQIDALALN